MTPSLLRPEDLQSISGLQYFARQVVDGLTGGRHRSPHKGSSLEFKEHRSYAQGDEIKTIDWKLFAKTDRLFIRQFEDETNLRAVILLDQSGSMGYAGQRPESLSKHQYAQRLAACWATLLVEQQDQVGLATFDTKLRRFIPPRCQQRQLNAIFQSLVESHPGGETSLGVTLKQIVSKLPRRGLLLLISDCFDQIDELTSALQLLRHSGHQILVLQVWDRDELEFPFRGRTQFRSLENSVEHEIDPDTIRQAYLQSLDSFRASQRRQAARLRIEWISCTTDQPCAEVLSTVLAARRRSNRRTAPRTSDFGASAASGKSRSGKSKSLKSGSELSESHKFPRRWRWRGAPP